MKIHYFQAVSFKFAVICKVKYLQYTCKLWTSETASSDLKQTMYNYFRNQHESFLPYSSQVNLNAHKMPSTSNDFHKTKFQLVGFRQGLQCGFIGELMGSFDIAWDDRWTREGTCATWCPHGTWHMWCHVMCLLVSVCHFTLTSKPFSFWFCTLAD